MAAPLDLHHFRVGVPPLWLCADGRVSLTAEGAADGLAAHDALVAAARWVSSRRTVAFERLYPEAPANDPTARASLSPAQADTLLNWLRACIAAASAVEDEAGARVRSACLTLLSHLVASGGHATRYADVSERAAEAIFAFVEAERLPALRAHATLLLQLRAPALSPALRTRAKALVGTLSRRAPPYAELTGAWNIAMTSAFDFHAGECAILESTFHFTRVEAPLDAPRTPRGGAYEVYEAPFRTPGGDAIRVFARTASPEDELLEMGSAFFMGLWIHRHAQLGSFDLRAARTRVDQQGYKLMICSQCAGLTTRFAITRLFPDADVYSSWDSTYFRTDRGGDSGKVIASEGLDCMVAILRGMAAGEDHAKLSERSRRVQWHHKQLSADPNFAQFIGPAHPAVLAKYADVNLDGKADAYDGYLDLDLHAIAEDLRASSTPRAPGVAASQISGEAAIGLNWAVGSMNRVAEYSDLWATLPGSSELMYAFTAGGFYDAASAPADVPGVAERGEDPGRLPALARYTRGARPHDLSIECLFHSHLAHSGKEFKRLMVAAEVLNRGFDTGALPSTGPLATLYARRCMLLLTLCGLLDFPADANQIDALWTLALRALNLPELSRSTVNACITSQDHDASNYYGSVRGLGQLMESLKRDPVVHAQLTSDDIAVGRALALA